MKFKSLNNFVTTKKDQSTLSRFFVELFGDNIIDLIYFVVEFKLYWSSNVSIYKYTIESSHVPMYIGMLILVHYNLCDLDIHMIP
jgi:hypothetical protein